MRLSVRRDDTDQDPVRATVAEAIAATRAFHRGVRIGHKRSISCHSRCDAARHGKIRQIEVLPLLKTIPFCELHCWSYALLGTSYKWDADADN